MAQTFNQETMGGFGGFGGFPGFGGFGSNLGGIGLFGLLGLNSLNRDHHHDCGKDSRAELAALLIQQGEIRRDIGESASDIRRDIGDAACKTLMEGCEIRKDISDARHEVTESESRLRETLHASDIARASEIRNVMDKICDGEKETLKIAHLLSREGLQNALDIKNQVREFEARTAENFCNVKGLIQSSTQAILNQLAADKLDEKNDEIARLRAKNHQHEQNILLINQFSNQFTAINSAIADLSQNQRLTNQTIQFGAGNTAGQNATNNQVR